jgi:Uma2 family endonuclease
MGNALRQAEWIAPEAYLAAEDASPRDRHEYLDGEIYLMTGGSLGNNTIALNLGVALRTHLKGTPCRVQLNDVRLHVRAANAYFYPDVFVHCGGSAASERNVGDAVLVVEVLSPSTERYDRGGKSTCYRLLETLREYVLVDTDFQQVEVFRRAENGDWVFHAYQHGDTIELNSIGLQVPVAEVYADSDVTRTEPLWIAD